MYAPGNLSGNNFPQPPRWLKAIFNTISRRWFTVLLTSLTLTSCLTTFAYGIAGSLPPGEKIQAICTAANIQPCHGGSTLASHRGPRKNIILYLSNYNSQLIATSVLGKTFLSILPTDVLTNEVMQDESTVINAINYRQLQPAELAIAQTILNTQLPVAYFDRARSYRLSSSNNSIRVRVTVQFLQP